MVFGQIRRILGSRFHEVSRLKERQIPKGQLVTDHALMCIVIPPKLPAVSVIGFLEEKSAIARKFGGRQCNLTGEHFRQEAMLFRRLASSSNGFALAYGSKNPVMTVGFRLFLLESFPACDH